MLLLVGCGGTDDQISFSGAEGAGRGQGLCDCIYRDNSHGDPSIQIACTSGLSLSFFLDPALAAQDQGADIIFTADTGSFAAGASGRFGKLGKERRSSSKKDEIVRDIDGVELRWNTQDACDAAYGCQGGKYHLEAGSLTGGKGGCQDFWSTVDQY